MKPRAVWTGFLTLERIACPVALYKATSEPEDVKFLWVNRLTGNRVKMVKLDAVTGEPVEQADIAKSVEVGPGKYVEITEDEIDGVAPSSSKVIDISAFVAPKAIAPLHFSEFYFLGPDGPLAFEAFAAMRIAIEKERKTAIAQVTMGRREHLCAILPCGNGMTLALLRYASELRDPLDCFAKLDAKPDADVVDGTRQVVDALSGEFKPEEFKDRYAVSLDRLRNDKIAGRMLKPPVEPRPPKMTSLADAVAKSVENVRKKRA